MVLYPEERKALCVKCHKHTSHKCSIYKKGKRRYDRKQRGYGGQTKPIFHKKAKVTKKNQIKLVCKECKAVSFKLLKRAHKLELQKPGASKKAKGAYEF